MALVFRKMCPESLLTCTIPISLLVSATIEPPTSLARTSLPSCFSQKHPVILLQLLGFRIKVKKKKKEIDINYILRAEGSCELGIPLTMEVDYFDL